MLRLIRYFFWKRMARKAVKEGRIQKCEYCDDPIVPGDFIGIGNVANSTEEKLVHAGYHFSLSKMDAFCETGAIGSAVWTGKEVAGCGESLAAKAHRTGKVQIM